MATEDGADSKADDLRASVLSEIKSRLEADRIRLHRQIGDYPQPIPACDAQFNYLLAERARLSADLKLVDALLTQERFDLADTSGIQRLIDHMKRIDGAAAEKLTAALQIDANRRYAP